MIYRAIGIMSGSSLDGMDIVFAEFSENAGKWSYEIIAADCFEYPDEWIKKLKNAIHLNAEAYQLLHADYGHYIGKEVIKFIDKYNLHYKIALIASHGHTTFHQPPRMTAQIGDGAAIAAETKLPVVSDLRAMDVAFGGQGAPIVPIGEKLLLGDYDYFLNLGGIANISGSGGWGFDVCPANRVLNMLCNEIGKEYDEGGRIAETGTVNKELLEKLNELDYYKQPYPKSLANDFGTDIVYPLIKVAGLTAADGLRTMVEHITMQIKLSIGNSELANNPQPATGNLKLLATGGGAFNNFLIERLRFYLNEQNIELVVPDDNLVKYKEALIMALIGVLRWRQEYTVIETVTGASRASIGGALWNGQEA